MNATHECDSCLNIFLGPTMTAGRSYRIYRIQNPELRQECEFSRIEESTTSNQSFVTKTQITTWFCFSGLRSSKGGFCKLAL